MTLLSSQGGWLQDVNQQNCELTNTNYGLDVIKKVLAIRAIFKLLTETVPSIKMICGVLAGNGIWT